MKRDRFLGSSRGTLVFDAEGLAYRTADKEDAGRWTYGDIKQVQILTPTRIAVLTYEDQGRLKFGADRTFQVEVVKDTVSPELVAFLLDRIAQPVVTAVMPPLPSTPPLYRVPVKYERRRGSEGTLLLREDSLVYLTETEGHARYWRLTDLFAVLRLDRYRLEVVAYEGGGGDTRRFTFQIKTEVPEGFYDDLWARVNAPAPDLLSKPRTARVADRTR